MAMRRVTLSFPWPFDVAETRDLLSFAFQVSLVTYLGYYLLETLAPGFVSLAYNLNDLLWLTIGLGVLTALWPALAKQSLKPERLTWKTWIFIIILTIAATGIVWYQTKSIGSLRNVIAPLTGLIVAGLAILLYFEDDESGHDHTERHEE